MKKQQKKNGEAGIEKAWLKGAKSREFLQHGKKKTVKPTEEKFQKGFSAKKRAFEARRLLNFKRKCDRIFRV